MDKTARQLELSPSPVQTSKIVPTGTHPTGAGPAPLPPRYCGLVNFSPEEFRVKAIKNRSKRPREIPLIVHPTIPPFKESGTVLAGETHRKAIYLVYELGKLDFEVTHGLFSEPIPLESLKGYTDIVKFPIDLCTIHSRCVSGWYRTLESLERDLRDMIFNCQLYNGKHSEFGQLAATLERKFDDVFHQCGLGGSGRRGHERGNPLLQIRLWEEWFELQFGSTMSEILSNLRNEKYASLNQFYVDLERFVRRDVLQDRDQALSTTAKKVLQHIESKSSEPRVNAFVMTNTESSGLSIECRRKLLFAVDELKKADTKKYFHLPPIAFGAEYAKKIADPIDLHTMRCKVFSGMYRDAAQFMEDVQRIARNSEYYNGQNHDVTVLANKLVKLVPSLMKDI
eukprot:PhF_6_TR798/c0_g1_i1/m.1219